MESVDIHYEQLTPLLEPDYDRAQITKERLCMIGIEEPGRFAVTLNGVLTPTECQELIRRTELTGYSPALVQKGDGKYKLQRAYLNGDWVIIHDKEFAARIFDRISRHLPKKFMNQKLIGMNERLRFLRYGVGHQFQTHSHESYIREDKLAATQLTVYIYLNDDSSYCGGDIYFTKYQVDDCVRVDPQSGMALVFEHDIAHKDCAVTAGRKYILHCDIFYTRESQPTN
ncbi:hypothetical protein HA402_014051 [Bradysia odoriphaga]|nr:hypothetical protein HA402_014051 [Bradysia odoriphaga]